MTHLIQLFSHLSFHKCGYVGSILCSFLVLTSCNPDWQSLNEDQKDKPLYNLKTSILYSNSNWHAVNRFGQELVAVGHAGTIIRSEDGGKQWTAVPSGTDQDLNALVREGQELVAVGDAGAIVRSEDGGKHWTALPSGTNQNLTAVVREGQEVVAVGSDGGILLSDGAIIRSEDGGKQWTSVDMGTGLNALEREGQELVAVGDTGTIKRSEDGGKQWTAIDSGTPLHLNALVREGQELVAVGDHGTILHSEDGGKQWTAVVRGTPLHLNALVREGQELVAVGDAGAIMRSEDGGKQWTVVDSGTNQNLTAVVREGQELVALGSDCDCTFPDGAIMRSEDGGKQWAAVASDTVHNLNALVREGQELVTVGDHGAILSSEDGGKQWAVVAPGRVKDLNAMVREDQELVAVGERGTIMRSEDGGKQWTVVASGTDEDLRALVREGQELVAVGKGIVASMDGGRNWTVVDKDMPIHLNALVREGQELVAVGNVGTIMRSEDGGKQWTLVGIDTDQALSAVVREGQELVAVGDTGPIMRSEDGGKQWTAVPSGTDQDLRALVREGQELVAVGHAGAIVRSEDGGKHWSAVPSGTPFHLNALVREGQELVAVGDAGAIMRSEDGGKQWTAVDIGTEHYLNAVVREGQELLAVGDGIMASIDGGRNWTALASDLKDALIAVVREGREFVAVGENGTRVFISNVGDPMPVASEALLKMSPLSNQDRLQVKVKRHDASCGSKGLSIVVSAEKNHNFVNEHRPLKVIGQKFGIQFSDAKEDIYVVPISLADKLGDKGIDLKPGEDFWYAVTLECNGWAVQYPSKGLGAIHSVYIPWYRRMAAWHWVLFVMTGFAALTFLVFLLKPIWIAQFHRFSTRSFPLADAKIPLLNLELGELLQLFNFFIVLLLVRHPKVLDAWVRVHKTRWREQFERSATAQRCHGYIPLPCVLEWEGHSHCTPNIELSRRLFDDNSRACEVLGIGGAGKTMLTIQLCRWMMNESGGDNVSRLPLLIEEELSAEKNGLMAVVKRKLKSMDIEENEDFLCHLMKKGRLMLVFDRLSEHDTSTVDYVSKINGIIPLGALLISTRHSNEYEGVVVRRIKPLPLESDSMMTLIAALLDQRENKDIFSTLKEQTELAQKLVELIQQDGHELKLTPLLVKLFVTQALKLANEGKSLSELPKSIPEAYFNYLRDINPKGSGENRLDDNEMLRAAKILAMQSLGDNFVPQDFPLDKGLEALKKAGWTDFTKSDPVKRLVANGVILIRTTGPRDVIAFALDPVAEYLAAAAHLEACDGNVEAKANLFEMVQKVGEPAKGFALALQLTEAFYIKSLSK